MKRRHQATSVRPAGEAVMLEHLESRALFSGAPFPTPAELVSINNTVVLFDTNYGDVYIELYDSVAPNGAPLPTLTVQNFLGYVQRGDYGDAMFHRLAFIEDDRNRPFVLQGGGFRYENQTQGVRTIPTQTAVVNEFSPLRPNVERTIAMAKTSDPNSATDQFYFNLDDNAALDNPNNSGGFTVFGRVANDASWNVIFSIVGLQTENLSALPGFTGPQSGNFSTTPVGPGFNPADGVSREELVYVEAAQVVKGKNIQSYYSQTSYYPEGFAGSTINEFLPIGNLNSTQTDYQVIVRSEVANNSQFLNLGGGTGQFRLVYFNPTASAQTALLSVNTTPAELQTALGALSGVGPANVQVTGQAGNYVITLVGTLANADAFFVLDSSGLTPGNIGVNPSLTKWFRDKVIYTGSIAPNSRGGITISHFGTNGAPSLDDLVPQGIPYSIEINGTNPLVGTISHYDFGTATGESFSRVSSTTWGFADALKVIGNAGVNSFLVWQNPTDKTASIQVSFYFQNLSSFTLNVDTDHFRRGGLSLTEIAQIANNTPFAIQVVSNQPLVAALTQFDSRSPVDPQGFTQIGLDGAGSSFGIIPYGNVGTSTTDIVSFFNPGTTSAVINLNLTFSEAGQADLQIPAAVIVQPQSRGSYNFGVQSPILANRGAYTVRYSAGSAKVYGGWVHTQFFPTVPTNVDAASNPISPIAATSWAFGEGFMDGTGTDPRAGRDLFETISVYNPNSVFFTGANTPVTVNLALRYSDGFVLNLDPVVVNGGRRYDYVMNSIQAVLDQGINNGRFYYSIEVTANLPVVVQMRHFDLTLGGLQPSGGFATMGVPGGTIVRLEQLGDAVA
ncbi:MAG: peptidylprolyl isomerase [Phycisphaeraceae bacterium]|nr:peptidylprolyl isomerase [Phycisphaeraceae bacterium]